MKTTNKTIDYIYFIRLILMTNKDKAAEAQKITGELSPLGVELFFSSS